MALLRTFALSAATAAMLIGAAAPAAAQNWGRGGYGRGGPVWNGYGGGWRGRGGGWGYRRGGDVGGALVGGLIVGGIVGALAASNRDRDRGTRDVGPSAQDRAADACAFAVEEERRADVRQVTRVDWFAEGWHVEGIIDGGDPDGPGLGRPDSFSCSYRYGKVDDIRYGSDYQPRG